MIETYCRKAEELNTTEWKQCRFLKGEVCNFSGSCEGQVDKKMWEWLKEKNS